MRALVVVLLLLAGPALAQSPIGPGGGSGGATTARNEGNFVLSSGRNVGVIASGPIAYYTATPMAMAVGQRTTIGVTLFKGATSDEVSVGFVDPATSHGYFCYFDATPNLVIYRSDSTTTKTIIGSAVSAPFPHAAWYHLELTVYPVTTGTQILVCSITDIQGINSNNATYVLGSGSWYPAVTNISGGSTQFSQIGDFYWYQDK